MNTAFIEPYLFFGGRCEEALAFYQTAVGAKTEMVSYFKDSPEPFSPGVLPEGFESKVMHATFRIGTSKVMASDGTDPGSTFAGFSLSLVVSTEGDAQRAFTALAQGGGIQMPLGRTFWSPCFGMLKDRFGVAWMVSVAT